MKQILMGKERYRSIINYKGLYRISDKGNVKSLKKGKILKPRKGRHGYLLISLSKDGVVKTHKLHRLIAIAFIPNPKTKPEVNHKDGNKLNNDLSNLEWNTHAENMQHACRIGLNSTKGERNKRSKLKATEVLQIRDLYRSGYFTLKELAVDYNCCFQNIHLIIKERAWKTA